MVREHFDAIDAEFAMTEAAAPPSPGRACRGQHRHRQPPGARGPWPRAPRARLVPRLTIRCCTSRRRRQVGRWQTPMRLNDTTPTSSAWCRCRRPSAPPSTGRCSIRRRRRPWLQSYLQEHSRRRTRSCGRRSSPRFSGGRGRQRIPSEAEATLDIRAAGRGRRAVLRADDGDHRRPLGEGRPHPPSVRRRPRASTPRCIACSSRWRGA
jgi:hypothetical protein